MNQLELFKSTVERRSSKEFLFYANFTPDLERRVRNYFSIDKTVNLKELFGMYDPEDVSPRAIGQQLKPDFSKYYLEEKKPEGSYINFLGVLNIPGSQYHFTRYVSPLRNATTIEEIKDFPYPNIDGYTEEHMKDHVEKIHKNGKVACCWITHMYEEAWQIRGYAEFLMDMIESPENCEYILDKICDRNMKKAVAAAKAGVDVLMTGDDVANQKSLMFSIETWRRFMKVRWKAVYDAAKKIKTDIQIWYHSDGNITDLLPDLIEMGVTILNPVQPECIDPAKMRKKYETQLVFDGTIGTQTIMPFGTPEDVRRTVQEMKEKVGYDGGLILSPTHVLEPEVPIKNVIAFIEACSGKTII
jgi:uroporphyrinogen decarboxylase